MKMPLIIIIVIHVKDYLQEQTHRNSPHQQNLKVSIRLEFQITF